MSNAVYRFEIAKGGRAGCQNSVCQKEGIKIEKGEIRMGTQVMFNDHFSWKWKHWGCVTPLQIRNLQSQVGPLEDLDLDLDLPGIIDGFDELDKESREKLKFALENGHVPDEDWKGEPELNRPGMKGINKRTPKKKAVEEDEDEEVDDNDETPIKPKARKPRNKKVKVEEEDEEDMPVSPVPKRKSASKRKVKVEDEDDDEDLEEAPAPKKSRTRKRKEVVKKEEEEEVEMPVEMPEEKPAKRSRARKVKAEEEDEPIPPPPKPSRAKKTVPQEPEEDEMPELPQSEPAKTGRKRKTAVPKKEEEDEDAKPAILPDENAAVETSLEKALPVLPKRGRGGRKGAAVKKETPIKVVGEENAVPKEPEDTTKSNLGTESSNVEKNEADVAVSGDVDTVPHDEPEAPQTTTTKPARGKKTKAAPKRVADVDVNTGAQHGRPGNGKVASSAPEPAPAVDTNAGNKAEVDVQGEIGARAVEGEEAEGEIEPAKPKRKPGRPRKKTKA